jgi:CDP-diacylglycerol--glycerol-3-phosphate 3-phosphatidyltransferase
VAIKSNFSHVVDGVVGPIGQGLARVGFSPNLLTTLGIVLTGVAGWVVILDRPVLAGWILVAGGLMDTFDGAVARAKGRSTPFGGFYDSVSDRVSDGIILAALAFWLKDEPRLFALAAVALVAAQVTSYVRARAEAIDLTCDIGIMERAERAILLMAALVFHRWLLEPILWVLAVGGVVTVVQRFHHVWCQIDRDIPDELMALTGGDRAWNRAFTAAARGFFGHQNFDRAHAELTEAAALRGEQ